MDPLKQAQSIKAKVRSDVNKQRIDMGLSPKFDLNTVEGLREAAGFYGKEPKKKEPFAALKRVAGVLNVGTAFSVGLTEGLTDPDISPFTQPFVRAYKSVKGDELIGFSDVIRNQMGYQPQTRPEKFVVGTAGFAADVLFDPLTYLTFGVSAGSKALKVGNQTFNKFGTKLAQETAQALGEKYAMNQIKITASNLYTKGGAFTKEAIEDILTNGATREIVQKYSAQGLSKEAVENIYKTGLKTVSGAKNQAKNITNRMFQEAVGAKGLTDDAIAGYVAKGLDEDVVRRVAAMGQELKDLGGIKFAGKSLVTGKQIAESPLGKAFNIIKANSKVQDITSVLGKLFVPDFLKNKKLGELISKGGMNIRRSMNEIIETNQKIFSKLSREQAEKFVDVVRAAKKDIVPKEDEILEYIAKKGEKVTKASKEKAAQVLRAEKKANQTVEAIVREFGNDKELIELSKQLFGSSGKPGTISKFASIAGITPDEMITAYFPDILKESVKKEGTKVGFGNLMSVPEIDAKKVFNGLLDKEDIITNPAEAYSRVQIAIMTQRIKDRTIRKVLKTMGKKINEFPSEKVANEMGFVKWSPKVALTQAERTKAKQLFGQLGELKKQADTARKALVKNKKAIKNYEQKLAKLDKAEKSLFNKSLNDDVMSMLKEGRTPTDRQILELERRFARYDDIRKSIDMEITGTAKESAGSLDIIASFKEQRQRIKDYKENFGIDLAQGKGEVWIPESIRKDMDEFVSPKDSIIDEAAHALGFDYATGLFKSYVTSLFPGFHMRNMVSNQFQNMLKIGVDVFNPKLQATAAQIVRGKNLDQVFITKQGTEITLREIRDKITKETDFLDQGAFGSIEQLQKDIGIDITGGAKKLFGRDLNPMSRQNIALKTGQKIGGFSEAQAKVVNILSNLQTGNNIKTAVASGEEALFNYGKLTDFERRILRRIIPFYTFGRKNFEYQMKMLFKQPGAVAAQLKGMRGFGEAIGDPLTEEDIAGLPSWALESVGIKAGANQYGQDTVITGFGLPIEEFLGRFSGEKGIVWNAILNTLQISNPLLKYPLEKTTGIDLFRGKPIEEITNAQEVEAMMRVMPPKAAEQLAKLIDFRAIDNVPVYVDGKQVGTRKKYVANPHFLHLLRNLPSARITATGGRFVDETQPMDAKLMNFLTGLRGYAIDQEQQKYFNNLKEMDELQKYLLQLGVVKSYERLYQPKDKTK
jgi:hypothetical protein